MTMRDVAAQAGVHISTVSRVLSGNHSRVSTHTQERVRRVALELGFHPHPGASSLRSGSTRIIGVLVPRITDVVLAATFEAIERAATLRGYQAVVASTWDDSDERRRRIELLINRRVDGLIIADTRRRSPHLHQLADRGIPFVLVSRRCGRWPSVTGNDRLGGLLVADHLASMGHERVAVIAGPPYASTAVDRVRGFRDEFARQGVELEPDFVRHTTFDVDGGRVGMHEILHVGRPTAVFAVNDYAAIGAMAAIREQGLVPGLDIAVVGYNDIAIASQLGLPLTSVRSRPEESGTLAVESLLQLIEHGETQSIVLDPELVVRATSTARENPTSQGEIAAELVVHPITGELTRRGVAESFS